MSQLPVRIPDDLDHDFRRLADLEDLSANRAAVTAISEWVERKKAKRDAQLRQMFGAHAQWCTDNGLYDDADALRHEQQMQAMRDAEGGARASR